MSAVSSDMSSAADEFRAGGWNARYVAILIALTLVPECFVLASLYPVNVLTQISVHFGTDQVAWIPAILPLGVVLGPILAKISDRVGKKKLLLIVMTMTVVGLLVSAFAPTYTILIIGRILQAPGAAAGFLVPSLVREIFPTRVMAFATMVASTGCSVLTAAALLLVGPVVEQFGFGATFWVPAVVGTLTLVLVILVVPESPKRFGGGRLDVLGAALLGGGFGAVLLGVSFGPTWGWTSANVLGAFFVGVVALAVWVVQSRRAAEPVVDLRELSNMPIVMTVLIPGLLAGVGGWFYAMMSIISISPPADGWGLGINLTELGYMAALWSLGTLCGGVLWGYAMGRVSGPKVLTGVATLMTVSFIVALNGLSSVALITIAAFLTGMNSGPSVGAAVYLLMRQVRPERQAVMTSILTMSYGLIASAVPVAVLATMNGLGTRLPTGVVMYSLESIRAGLLIPLGMSLLALICTFVLSATLPKAAARPMAVGALPEQQPEPVM